jgi:hypothetical protein
MAADIQTAFGRFHAATDEMRALLESTPRFRDRQDHRAQAYVCLAEAQAMAYNQAIAPRLDNAQVYSEHGWHSCFYTLGTNCQDFRYANLYLDGSKTYRLVGTTGDLALVLLQVHSFHLGHPGSAEIGNYDFDDFELGPDGEFELILSATEHEGNWVRLDGDSDYNFLQSRRILRDISDNPGSMQIERLDDAPIDAPLDPAAMARRFEHATHLLEFLIRDYAIGLYDMYIKGAGAKNKLWIVGGKDISDILGSPSTTYGLGVYDIEPDQAIIVEWEPPAQSAYWSWQLGDVWSRSLDFFSFQTDLNMNSATIDADGKVRLVIAEHDPGVPNWLDCRGRLEGSLVMRDYKDPDGAPTPDLHFVKASELRSHLPAETPVVTAEERDRALADRRTKYRDAYRTDRPTVHGSRS